MGSQPAIPTLGTSRLRYNCLVLKPKSPAQFVVTAALLLAYGFLITQKINLHKADLGRHLKNGEIAVKEQLVPPTNYYSYTSPDFPFLNHHWGTGVLFYLIWAAAGFKGLSVFISLASLATLLIFLRLSNKYSHLELTALASLVMVPVLASRTEIRPEVVSYLLMAVFFWILWENKQSLNDRPLLLLPLLELIWVNLHVYFFLGVALIGLFLFSAICNKDLKRTKALIAILLATMAVTLINPAGIKGALYPLNIFSNYGYRVLENQSVLFLSKVVQYPPSAHFVFSFFFLLMSWLAVFLLDRRNFLKSYLELFLLSLLVSFLGWQAVRNFAIFAYFALFITAFNLKTIKDRFFYPYTFTLSIFISFALFFLNASYWSAKAEGFGLGLTPNTAQAAQFYLTNNLKGPIFNNYDNGGYLIFYLFPQEKVFVDNRPEAYPTDFFSSIYIPMQENEENWRRQIEQYNLNTIFFYRWDYTPWAQAFLIKRVSDPDWAPVYVDDYSIIFVKRNQQNQKVIESFEIPKSTFTTSP